MYEGASPSKLENALHFIHVYRHRGFMSYIKDDAVYIDCIQERRKKRIGI